MIPKEKATKFIQSKKTAKPNLSELKKFSKTFKIFAKIIVSDKIFFRPKSYYIDQKLCFDKFIELFGDDYSFNPFKEKEGTELSVFLFGELHGKAIPEIWELINKKPYQTGYNRRSFRNKVGATHLQNKIIFIQNLYKLTETDNSGYLSLNIYEIAQYSIYNDLYYSSFSNLIAVELNKSNEKLRTLINDIFNGEDEIGGVSNDLIRGCLLSDDPICWEMVGKLLLAAQRQEGLRQTVLEALDETSIGALKYIVKLILDHNLFRFSAVVRAIDTWFGFGWDAPKKATIKRVLSLANAFFNDSKLINTAIKSKDNLEVYVALWTNAVINDVDISNIMAIDIIKNGSREKKILAFIFMKETGRTNTNLLPWIYENLGSDTVLDYYMLSNRPSFKLTPKLFATIKRIATELPKTGLKVKGVFDWLDFSVMPSYFYTFLIDESDEKQLEELGQNIKIIPSDEREKYFGRVFPKHKIWAYTTLNNGKIIPIRLPKNHWKRGVMHQAITDRNLSVMVSGLNVLRAVNLTEREYDLMPDLLKRKSVDIRGFIISQIAVFPNKIAQNSIATLIESKNIDQRLGGLEILSILNEENKMPEFVNEKISLFKERKKLSKNEEVYLDKFNNSTSEFSFENGFGIIDYNNFKPIFKPENKFKAKTNKGFKNILSKFITKDSNIFGDYIDISKTTKAVNDLIAIFDENKNYEYTHEGYYYEDNLSTTLLSKNVTHKVKYNKNFTNLEWFNQLPLANKWKEWYDKSKLNDFELILAIDSLQSHNEFYYKNTALKQFFLKNKPALHNINIKKKGIWNSKEKKISYILEELFFTFADLEMAATFLTDVLESAIATFPEYLKNIAFGISDWKDTKTYWSDFILSKIFGKDLILRVINKTRKNIDLQERYWQCRMHLFYANLSNNKMGAVSDLVKLNPQHSLGCVPEISITVHLYHNKIINDDELLYHSLLQNNIFLIFEGLKGLRRDYEKSLLPEKFPHNLYKQLKKNLLEIELERGDLHTEASPYVSKMLSVEGYSYLFRILGFLGKENLNRGYFYGNTPNRKQMFSQLIKICTPKKEDTLTEFIESAKDLKLPKKRWLEVAMYAPQWSNWVGELLKIDKLESAVWWFHAHASDYMNAKKETIISRYSNIDKGDFIRGSLDLDWFNEVYPSIKKSNWSILTDACKYISDGNAHRLVKLYSSVILGEIKIKQTLDKIKTKRDKDYLKALGLIPLSKTIPKKDLLKRYNLLQMFLKESKQFGSQRQESEKNAVEIAMDNLSRTANYPDSIRFSLAMEAKYTQKIMEKSIVVFDDAIIKLMVSNEGKAEIITEKNGKKQKSIPTKYRKEKAIEALKEGKTYLRKQYSRTKKFLEEAMIREDEFSIKDIENIMHHPVVNTMLSKLVLFFKEENKLGFWTKNGLIDVNNENIILSNETNCVIAHPAHLYQTTTWDLYQKHAFDTKLIQPFKQIFREYYLITKDEKEKGNLSERYQGHQIQPKKTVALLRTKGWTVNHEEGLQKVFHKKGYIATLYAMADWFSPSDVEAPTLEYVSFESRKDYKNIPLEKIDAVTFSEVMRDVDLVVSVAHVGGVDPEASHSTLEMRAVLAKESARLFKLQNIEVKQRHIIIKGKLGTYSIHLGSGIVSKNGMQLSIIPVHSQHRGRIFLPFVDDDPKSAEIISKMKLLSEDNKIQDPTILAQINMK